ncbi:Hypothetical protein CINCED_3A006570 [Cinara cedri]|uniref:Reverse transcriptase n=1 Tax=Cinara cedri TaxID=506608 RepID=A0A5E4M376_9HEMI|nr:Hypothetical protein CINCED_3A006570 [Cinara cedri]
MRVKCGGSVIESKKAVKYLSITVDQKMNFIEHATLVHNKVSKTLRQLWHILPNMGGARESKRHLLVNVAMAQLLYGAPCWEADMGQSGWRKIEPLHRRIAILKVCAYRSVSYAAVAVVAGMPPIRLLAKERAELYDGLVREGIRRKLMENWQRSWNEDLKGRWTHRLIPKIDILVNRRHGEVGHWLCQFLTGHGSFGVYLVKWRRRSFDKCQLCGITPDTIEHVVYNCDA